MRWQRRDGWGPRPLGEDEWAVLEAQIAADDLPAVEYAVEEITGFMDGFREDVDGKPVIGVTDGQLSVVTDVVEDRRGRRVFSTTFYASGAIGTITPHAFERLASAASSLVDHLQADGIPVENIRWIEHDYIKRIF